ncbi:hypothetical protein FRC09_016629, partial [Ceratobasidium sp. 395]
MASNTDSLSASLLSELVTFLRTKPSDFDWIDFIDFLDRAFPLFACDMSELPEYLRPQGNSREEYPWLPNRAIVPPRSATEDTEHHLMPENQNLSKPDGVAIPVSHVRGSEKGSERVESDSGNPASGGATIAQALPSGDAERSSSGVPFVDPYGGRPVLPAPAPSVHSASSVRAPSPGPADRQLPPLNVANLLAGYPGAVPQQSSQP